MILFLAIIAYLALIVSWPVLGLIVLGCRHQIRVATEAANRNAGYWAQSEAERGAISHAAARLQGERDALDRITREALQLARQKQFGSDSPVSDPIRRAREYLHDNPCQWEFKDPDDALNATEIDA